MKYNLKRNKRKNTSFKKKSKNVEKGLVIKLRKTSGKSRRNEKLRDKKCGGDSEKIVKKSKSIPTKRKRSGDLEKRCDSSTLSKSSFSPFPKKFPDQELILAKIYSENDVKIQRRSLMENRFRNTKFIVLDSLEEAYGLFDYQFKKPFSHEEFKPNSNDHVKGKRKPQRRSIFPPKLRNLTEERKSRRDKSVLARSGKTIKLKPESTTELPLKGSKNSKLKLKLSFREKAAGDGKQKEEKENLAEEYSSKEPFQCLSKTFFDICQAFTFKSPTAKRGEEEEEDVSKIDGEYIRSLLKIAKSSGKVESSGRNIAKEKEKKKGKMKKIKEGKKERDKGSMEKDSFEKRKKTGGEIEKGEEHSSGESKMERRSGKIFSLRTDSNFLKNSPIESSLSRNRPPDTDISTTKRTTIPKKINCQGIQLAKIKSERIKVKEGEERRRKSRGKSSKTKGVDLVEVPFKHEASTVKEIWRNVDGMPSENSLSGPSSRSGSETEICHLADPGMKSYATLRKIVEDEVRRICKNHSRKGPPIDGDTVAKNPNLEATDGNVQGGDGCMNGAQIRGRKLTFSEFNRKREKDLPRKPSSRDPYEGSAGEKVEKLGKPDDPAIRGRSLEPEAENLSTRSFEETGKGRKEKIDRLKSKLTYLEKETVSHGGKIPSEIIKNWSVLRRLEKAFLALGPTNFPKKNYKESPPPSLKNGEATRKTPNPEPPEMERKINREEPEIKWDSSRYGESGRKIGDPVKEKSNVGKKDRRNVGSIRPSDLGGGIDKSDFFFSTLQPKGFYVDPTAKTFPNGISEAEKIAGAVKSKQEIRERSREIDPISCVRKKPLKVNQKSEKKEKSNQIKAVRGIDPKRKESSKSVQKPREEFDKLKIARNHSNTRFEIKSSRPRVEIPVIESNAEPFSLERKATFDVIPSSTNKWTEEMGEKRAEKEIASDKRNPKWKTSVGPKAKANGAKEYSDQASRDQASRDQAPRDQAPRDQAPRDQGFERRKKAAADSPEKSRAREIEIGVLNPEAAKKNCRPKRTKQEKVEVVMKILKPKNLGPVKETSNEDSTSLKDGVDPKREAGSTSSTLTFPIWRRNSSKPVDTLICRALREEESESDNFSEVSSRTSTGTYRVPTNSHIGKCLSSVSPSLADGSIFGNRENSIRRKRNRLHGWEKDINQYREIVSDIMDQYQRTNGFLRQSQRVTGLSNHVSWNKYSLGERDVRRERNFTWDFPDIVEYRKKIMLEYDLRPMIEYKSKILESDRLKPETDDYFLRRNLIVARNVAGFDSDVKDQQPKVQKILDSQFYVDKKSMRRRRTGGQQAATVPSLQEIASSGGGTEDMEKPNRKRDLFKCLSGLETVQPNERDQRRSPEKIDSIVIVDSSSEFED